MGFSVNTNTNALAALQTLNQTNRGLSTTQARINTGFKVNGAKDNASTFAIAQGMRGDIAGLRAVQESLSLGSATVNVALEAAQKISTKLNEMKDKVVQGQASNVDREKIQADIESLKSQITDIANAAQFNGVNMLKTDTSNALVVTSSLNRTASSGSGSLTQATIGVDSQDMTATGVGVSGVSITGDNQVFFKADSTAAIADGKIFKFTVGGVEHAFEFTIAAGTLASTADATHEVHAVVVDPATQSTSQMLGTMFGVMRDAGFTVNQLEDGTFSVTAGSTISAAASDATGFTDGAYTGAGGAWAADTVGSDATTMINTLEVAIDEANDFIASLGVAANRIETQNDFVKSLSDTLTAGVSTLVDADLAEESAVLQSLQTKQQLGLQALSIANQQSGAVLSLFR